jgi:hypothetical protein
VDVVDRQQQRRPVRQVGAQPVQPVQHGERAVGQHPAARAAGGRLEDRRGQPGRALEQRGTVGGGHDRLEQLPHDAERELALELRPARTGHGHAPAARDAIGGEQQLRLADSAGALHEHRRARAAARRLEPLGDHAELPVPVEQKPLGHGGKPRHVRNVLRRDERAKQLFEPPVSGRRAASPP